ncbi:MAG: ABC transporter permease [Tissierellia bacterium]|nr:ABC transporter permease [Tissierellia bacterium]
MKKKWKNININYSSILVFLGIVFFWQVISVTGLVPSFLLPSPGDVLRAFVMDFSLLLHHLKITLVEALLGLGLGLFLGFLAALLMDRYPRVYRGLYPLLVVTQTVPTVAIAPLLVLWMGYEMAPKITLIVIVTFFPIAVNLYEGFQHADPDQIKLIHAMGGNTRDVFKYVKWPAAYPQFFSSLKIAVSYSVVGAVIAEWLGGFAGLGVYMTKVKKSYSFDKMFAVIFLISILSLLLMGLVRLLQRKMMPWIYKGE